MLRLPISLVLFALTAVLPFAVQHRLDPGDLPRPDAMAASALTGTPATSRRGIDTGAGRSLRVRRAADGMFYVMVRLNGRPTRFLVDTGASMVVLSTADARAAGIADTALRFDGTVRTVSGEGRVAHVTIDRMEIAGNELHSIDAAVIDGGIGVSLLGQTALAHLSALSIEQDELTLR